MDRLHHSHLALDVFGHPVDGRDVGLGAAEQQLPPVPRVVDAVRAKLPQVKLEALGGGGDVDGGLDLRLLEQERFFFLVRLQKPER